MKITRLFSRYSSPTRVALLLGVVILGSSCTRERPSATDQRKVITLGAILSLTGSAAEYGENAQKGIELALKHQAADSLKYRYRVIVEDDKTLPQDAVSAFQKLVSEDHVTAIIGPLPSSNAMAVAPLADQQHVVILSPGASTPRLTTAGPYVFRNWQSDVVEAQVMSDYLIGENIRKVAVFAINNDFGLALSDYFKKEFTAKGGTVPIAETFDQGAVNFRAQLLKLKDANPQGVYLLSYPNETAHIVNQMHDVGLKARVFGVSAMEDPTLLSVAGANANGIVYTKALGADTTDVAYRNFITWFRQEYRSAPGLIADTGYDAAKMLMLAISRADPLSGPAIAAALDSIKNYDGASGIQSFDANGDIIKPVGLKIIRDGKFEWLRR